MNLKHKNGITMDLIDTQKRRLRATESNKISLCDIFVHQNFLHCQIRGSNDTLYHVSIWVDYYDNTRSCCDCPDFVYRNNICKHMYWLSYFKMSKSHPGQWTKGDVINLVNTEKQSSTKGRNNVCPICCEDINYHSQETVCCESSCTNAVHAECWRDYMRVSRSAKCVMCRSEFWLPQPFMRNTNCNFQMDG